MKLKILATSVFVVGALGTDDWIMIIGILITVLSMVQQYLKGRK